MSLSVYAGKPNSGVVVLPVMTVFPRRSSATTSSSTSDTTSTVSEPKRVRTPRTWLRSFTGTTTPCSTGSRPASGDSAHQPVRLCRLRQRQVVGDGDEGPDGLVQRVGAGEVVAGQLDGGDLPRTDRPGLLERRQVMQLHPRSLWLPV